MKRLAALLLAAASLGCHAGIVGMSSASNGGMVLLAEECSALKGWGAARMIASGTKYWGCWQLRDDGVVVARWTPAWKDVFYEAREFTWLPNIPYIRGN